MNFFAQLVGVVGLALVFAYVWHQFVYGGGKN